jgi:4-hydroxy-2-oxoheptanedioate aldolase
MNVIEKGMVQVLKELREKFGVFEIKAEFEAEGSCMDEMMRLKDVTTTAGLPLIIKIGGVEAVTDIYSALQIGVKGVIAPMAETPFALTKFINMIDTMVAKDNASDIEFAFNMETITTFNCLDEMLQVPNLSVIQAMTIGRVDLTGSMNLDRQSVDSPEIFRICYVACEKAKQKGLKTGVGGAISPESMDFIGRLHKDRLLDKFETRKVVFPAEAVVHGKAAFLKAIEFELEWLKSKRRFYSMVKVADEKRIAMLEKRLACP